MTEPCADRCSTIAEVLVELAHAHGRSERAERVAHGLTPEFVPPLPRVSTSAAARWLTDEHED